MRRVFGPGQYVGIVLLASVLVCGAVRAQGINLEQVRQALAAVRASRPADNPWSGGHELASAKRSLRTLIERQLPPVQPPAHEGVLNWPDNRLIAALSVRLNSELAAAGLTCGDPSKPDPCATEEGQEDERGYLGQVRVWGTYDNHLWVTTKVGIRCGYDESAYLYEQDGRGGWRLLLRIEQGGYGKDYAPENFMSLQLSPEAAQSVSGRLPLVLALGYAPQCASNWNMLHTRLWRTREASPQPPALLDRRDELYMGDDAVASARLRDYDLLLEWRGRSSDVDKLVRTHVLHWSLDAADHLQRTDPLALTPGDFVEEWLSARPGDDRNWFDPVSDRSSLSAAHSRLAATFESFDGPPTQCRNDRTLWQVLVGPQPNAPNDLKAARKGYLLVRWTAPYTFRLVSADGKPFEHCDDVADLPDPVGTLFPETGWMPQPW